MYEEVVEKILKSLNENLIASSRPKLSGKGYNAHSIDVKNFHEIEKNISNKRIAYVDGGNAEIIGSGNFSLSLIRVCHAVYQNNKKLLAKKSDFFLFVNAIIKNDEIFYATSTFGLKGPDFLEDISFSSFDHTLMLGANRAEISNVANAIRRFAELRLAKIISKDNFCDVIVLDGNLQSTLTNESSYLNELYNSCETNNVILTAISKTASLFTDDGNLLSVVLDNISNIPSWFYYPIADINNPS
ncbi:hypothetical protein HYY71_07310, partial [Candidatus Woesearchaeota archaeon]|nr:hypothetical protein [Candidatus Woesearchaeota archaeon]